MGTNLNTIRTRVKTFAILAFMNLMLVNFAKNFTREKYFVPLMLPAIFKRKDEMKLGEEKTIK